MHQPFKFAHTLILTLLMLSVTGCANQSLSNTTHSPLELNGSEMAYFWVTKDTLISWQQILPQSAIDTTQAKTSYRISFVINASGTMQQVSMVNMVDGTQVSEDKLTGIGEYQFYPTAKNFNRQAVMVNTLVSL